MRESASSLPVGMDSVSMTRLVHATVDFSGMDLGVESLLIVRVFRM